ncbi:MAG: AIM24 family protein, partial [Planctomycetaceae bacterium]|nr:AIM24 family protein [Planctomycetaceae bacterium]
MVERYDLDGFIAASEQKDLNEGVFELESDRMLEVNLNNSMVWTKLGAMVGYRGDLKFTREGIFEQGLGNLFKKMLTSEGARLTRV